MKQHQNQRQKMSTASHCQATVSQRPPGGVQKTMIASLTACALLDRKSVV